jgi:kumamolisin
MFAKLRRSGGTGDGTTAEGRSERRRRRARATGAALLAIGLGGTSLAAAGASGAASKTLAPRVLSASVPRLVRAAHRLGTLSSSKRLTVALPLTLPDRAALSAYVASEYAPGSPNFHKFLKPAQFGQRFGASASEVSDAIGALHADGLKTATLSANHLYVSATGTVATLEHAFGVQLDRYQLPSGHTFYANASNIKLPASISGVVTGVVGLDTSNFAVPQLAYPTAHAVKAARAQGARSLLAHSSQIRQGAPVGEDGGASPCTQAVAGGGYTAPDLATAYDFNGLYAKGFHGEGMSAALVEFDDYHDSNVAAVESCYGIKTPVSRRLVDGGSGGPPAGGEVEDMADIGTILEMDPDLAHLYVYVAPTTGTAELDLFNAYVSDDQAPVLSASWGNCEEFESQSYNQLFATIAEEAAAQGQQIFEAAGDSGAVDCRGYSPPSSGSISVEQEAAVPWITGVGGTDLSEETTVAGSGVHHEDTWNDGGAGGGGQSVVWPMPSWQSDYLSAAGDTPSGADTSTQATNTCGASQCRMVPDISLNADPDAGGAANGGPTPAQFATDVPPDVGSPGYSMYCDTPNCEFTSLIGGPPPPAGAPSPVEWFPIGGTSLATPLAASAAVLWDQEAKAAGMSNGLGFLNPQLYSIASNPTDYASDFHDITTDSNDDQYDTTDCPSGCNPDHLYQAGTDYDMASGLGSIDAANLGADLVANAAKPYVTPSTESMYGYNDGGPTTTQPVSVTSGYPGTQYTATSDESWLHVTSPVTVPGTLSWYVDPTGVPTGGPYTGHITITGDGGSTTLTVTYSVGPRATISVNPSSLSFAEQAVDSSGDQTPASCGSSVWNDELMDSPDFEGGDYNGDTVDPNSLQTLDIGNSGLAGSTLHWEAFFYSETSAWLNQDLNPNNDSTGFQTGPSTPLVPTSGSVAEGASPDGLKLASLANGNTLGGYPAMNQGTYTGQVQIRDLADPSVLVTVPATLVLGSGQGTPTIAANPNPISVSLASGQSTTVNLVLSDSSGTCGYAYSLSINQPWATVNPDLYSGTVGASPATSAPSASDTGDGNGYTPVTIDAAGLAPGTYNANVIVQSQNAAANPTTVPIALTVTGAASNGPGGAGGGGGSTTKPPPIQPSGPTACTAKSPLSFTLHPPHHARVLEAQVWLNGRLVHTYRGKNLKKLSFARPKTAKYSLKILTKLSDREQWRRTASYSGCTASHVKLVQVRKGKGKKKKNKG